MSEDVVNPANPGAESPKLPGRPAAMDQPTGFDPFSLSYWVGKIDLRPVALFRICFATFLFYDLCDLFPSMRIWFSDEGAFPRAQFLPGPDHWARTNRFCLMDSFGTVPMVYVWWFLAAAAVVCLALGYKTRVAAVATWLVMVSFDERLPPLYDGSDTVIRMLSLWLMFIPSGNVWSVDAVKAEKEGKPLPREACAFFVRLLQLQLAWIYLNTALCKFQGHYWQNGTALHFALRLTHVFARPWAWRVADYLPLVQLMTWGTLVIEVETILLLNLPVVSVTRLLKRVGPLGIIILAAIGAGIAYPIAHLAGYPPLWTQWACIVGAAALGLPTLVVFALIKSRGFDQPQAINVLKVARAWAICGVITLHIGIMLTINVGLFSYLMPLTMFALFEPEWAQKVWDWAKRVLPPGRPEAYHQVALALPAPVGFDPPLSSYFSPGFKSNFGKVGGAAVGVFFLLCTWYSLPKYLQNQIPLPSQANTIVEALDSWNSWDMFSPDPLSDDYHLTAPGVLEDGTPINVLGHPDGDERSIWFSRWYKYFENVIAQNQQIKLEWGRFMCREQINNRRPGEKRLYKWTLYKDDQLIPPIDQPWPPVVRDDIWDHQCLDDVKPPPENPVAQSGLKP